MVYFQPESHVASCKTLDGAMRLSRFMQGEFSNNSLCRRPIEFCAVIETTERVSVHSSYPVNEVGKSAFKKLIADFKLANISAAA